MVRFVLYFVFILITSVGCGSSQSAALSSTEGVRRHEPSIDEEVARLFTHPFPEGDVPYGFQFSPDGRSLAYFRLSGQLDSVVPQLWLLDVGTGRARAIWDTPSLQIASFEWFPDSRRLLVNAAGNLHVVDSEGASPRQLTTTESSLHQLSPDGRFVAFVRAHDLWMLDVESGRERRLTDDGSEARLNGEVDWVYEEELELSQAFWWSPESQRLAFLQFDESPVTAYPVMVPGHPAPQVVLQRYPQAGEANPRVKLGVIEVTADPSPSPTWLELGTPTGEESYVARVGWTPGGEDLFIITLDRLQRVLRLSLIDSRGEGSTRMLIEERDEQWLNLLDEPRFIAQGRQFLWRSEADGQAHLYLHDAAGQTLRQITGGPWEVAEVVRVDEESGEVAFIANRGDSSSYHLFTTTLEGGDPRQISRQSGCHDVIFSSSGSHYIDTHSSMNRPPRAELHGGEGTPLLVVSEDDLRPIPDLETVEGEILDIPGPEGIHYKARLFRPAQLEQSRRYPALVWVYNGPGAQIVRDEWRTKYVPWMRLLAQRGVLVFSMDGRGTSGRGRDWEKPIYGRLTEVELEDQLRGVEHLRSQPFVDGSRIGIFGWSYGGTMVLAALLRHPGTFSVGVSVAPVTDWRFYDTIYTERYMMRPQDNPEGYQRTALWPQADQLGDPLLLIHGLSDDNVHFRNTSRMIEALIEEGRRFDVMVYPGQTHGISAPASRRHVFSTITSYLLDHLLR